jgi:hypothetical protein
MNDILNCRIPRVFLEIMRRFVALPWVRKLGSPRAAGLCGSLAAGFSRDSAEPAGRKVHSVMVCRRPSPFDLGPFKAGY